MKPILNAMTVDVEDYFMVSAFERHVPKAQWDSHESRVVRNTHKVLVLLEEAGVLGTFFILGWVAERYPHLVREIHARGHEVACHGHDHRLVYDQMPAAFREDLRRAKKALEDACGAAVLGYRAPSFSIVKRSLWALDILREEGFRYDASFLPASHARGGLPDATPAPHKVDGLDEFPMSTMRLLGRDLPFSGGGYFRLFPYGLIRRGVEACHRRGNPVITYLHPWEFDPQQPRLKAGPLDRFRHYVNLDKTEGKLRRLMKDFSFGRVDAVLAQVLGTGV